MAVAVITGSTKGIGRAMAEAFLKRGHNVAICSRNPEDVAKVTKELDRLSRGGVIGQVCDTTDHAQLQALWDATIRAFGKVDYWINNAGRAVSRFQVHEMPDAELTSVINSNVLGTTYASQVAMNGFRAQGNGALYNMLGGSFQGKMLTPNMGVYSSTKAYIHRLTMYLEKENKDIEGILVGSISPGMLITENWFDEQQHVSPEEWENIKPILNILCDYVEDVCPWIVDQVLENTENGKRIAWLSGGKMAKRFFDAKVLRKKRNLFERFDM